LPNVVSVMSETPGEPSLPPAVPATPTPLSDVALTMPAT